MDDYDKTCLESALLGVCNIVQQEWGAAIPCQVWLTALFRFTACLVIPAREIATW